MKKIIFNKKGITLVELLLALALLSIAVLAASSIFFTGNKSFGTSKDIGFAQQDARLMADYIKNEIRMSKDVYINEEDIESDVEYYTLSLNGDKKLFISYSEDTSKNKVIGSPIDKIEFKQIKDSDSKIKTNVIGLIVSTKENECTRQYEVDISFENGNIVKIDESKSDNPITTIYYTKY